MAKNFGRVAAGLVAGVGFLTKLLSKREAPNPSSPIDKDDDDLDTEHPGISSVSDLTDVDEDPGMATLAEVKAAIKDVEDLNVTFIYSGRSARSSKRVFQPYPYRYKLTDDLTVTDFINRRIRDSYEHYGLEWRSFQFAGK